MLDLLIEYKYIAFFIGMFIGGDIVLITAIYLATRNYFDIRALIIISYLATILSDIMWYFIGKYATRTKINSFLEKKRDLVSHVSRFMDKHGYKAIVYSKFIYGTRTIAQVIAGMHHMNLSGYTIANSIGTVAYILLLIALGYVFNFSTQNIQAIIHNGGVILGIFVVAIMLINIWINKSIKKRLYQ